MAQAEKLGQIGSYKPITRQLNITRFLDLPERLRKRVSLQPCRVKGLIGNCWRWNGPLYNGYGRQSWAGINTEKAHRVAYILMVGPIAPELELDHLCQNRACINPLHLEPVTREENIRRSHVVGKGNGTKTHCRNGHEYTPQNTYWYGPHRSKRHCRACLAANNKTYQERKRRVA